MRVTACRCVRNPHICEHKPLLTNHETMTEQTTKRYIYALGFFDGVHRGHRQLLAVSRHLADSVGAGVGVVTFSGHPDTLVTGVTPRLINTGVDREILLREAGAQKIITLPFNRRLQHMPWQEFLELNAIRESAAGFVCGEDFRFGDGGAGNADCLSAYCRENGLLCAVVPDQKLEGKRISSTEIRDLIADGEMETACAWLGHPHLLTGVVVHGQHLGSRLGFPTANLTLPNGVVIPRFGVYACTAEIGGRSYPAVTNVGVRPTVNGAGVTVEPWILDYSGNLYGKAITLEFYAFLRPERKFASLEELTAEIHRNARQTREYFRNHPADSLQILKN